MIDSRFGKITRIERQVEMPFVVIEDEIRRHVRRRIGPAFGVKVARFGRKAGNLFDRLAEFVLGNLKPGHQFFVMLFDKLVEIALHDLAGQPAGAGIKILLIQLQQQTLLQVTGTYTGRFEFVDNRQQSFQVLDRNIYALREGDVVGDSLQTPAQIAVLLDTADQINGQTHILLREIAVSQLFDQVLLQRTSARKGGLARFIVFRIVVDTALIGRSFVFPEVFLHRNLLRLLVLRSMIVFLQHDVLLDLLLDPLLELHGRQLQQFDHLNLLG